MILFHDFIMETSFSQTWKVLTTLAKHAEKVQVRLEGAWASISGQHRDAF